MSKTEPSPEDRINSWGAVVDAISGLLSALAGLSKDCREAVEALIKLDLTPWVWLVIALVLLISGALLSFDKIIRSLDEIKQLFYEFTKCSLLRRPDALWLKAARRGGRAICQTSATPGFA
jgi:hypothetical protein